MLDDVIPYYTCFKRKALHVLLYKFPPGQTFARVPTGKQSCPWASYLCLGAEVTNWSEQHPRVSQQRMAVQILRVVARKITSLGELNWHNTESDFYPQSNSQNTHQKCRIFTVTTVRKNNNRTSLTKKKNNQNLPLL